MIEMDRKKALDLLKKYVKDEKMIQHCIASEAVLRAAAKQLGENPDQWGLAGLLHDIDVEITNADPKTHGQEAIKILQDFQVDEKVIEAISLHNEESTDIKRSTRFHHALAAGETITGLIKATALVYPDKKVASVKPKSIRKRMKEKLFAASVNRDNIRECEQAGIPLDEFIDLSLNAMKEIGGEIGL